MQNMQNVSLSIDAVVQRMEAIEARNRWYGKMTYLTLIAIMGLFVMGLVKTGGGKVIEAEKFILRDGQGKVRGGLAIDSDNGTVRLALADGDGKTRADLSLTKEGRVGLYLIDEASIVRTGITLLPGGRPDFGLADEKGEVRAGIGFDKNTGRPAIVLYDVDGQPVWRALDDSNLQ